MQCDSISSIDFEYILGSISIEPVWTSAFIAFCLVCYLFNLVVRDIQEKIVSKKTWFALFVTFIPVLFFASILEEMVGIISEQEVNDCSFYVTAIFNTVKKALEMGLVGVLITLISMLGNYRVDKNENRKEEKKVIYYRYQKLDLIYFYVCVVCTVITLFGFVCMSMFAFYMLS